MKRIIALLLALAMLFALTACGSSDNGKADSSASTASKEESSAASDEVAGKKANDGFTLVYAYAGSECYFNKRDYLIIAAAPVVFWGVVFLLLLFLLPANWRWVPYVWQLFNLSGAAGDFYVFWRLRKENDTILCQDTGVKMAVFDRA